MPAIPVLSYALFEGVAERRLQKRISRVPPENEDLEANVRWGTGGTTPQPVPWNFITFDEDDEEPEDPEPEEQTITYDEVSRETEDIRVENPDDPEIYVMVTRIKTITFSSSENGVQRTFKLSW